MARIGFIGLGNMGLPMSLNLRKAEHSVAGFDMNAAAIAKLVDAGGTSADGIRSAVENADAVITMLPSGREVRDVYLNGGMFEAVKRDTLLIDCSTIDVESARTVAAAAGERGLAMLDAPVSGGVAGAQAATLTFMVGIVHAGPSGNGQAAKICNNMVLGISMIAVSEAFVLAERLGLDAHKLFEISSKSSGQCWSLTNYCPVPGPVPSSPANRDYQPGFTAAMMLKDLRLAQDAARSSGASTPLGAEAAALYNLYVGHGFGGRDFSGIIRFLRGS